MRKTFKGFTLIELMIAVAIVGIIAAIAAPFYGDYLTRTRRTDATGDLLRIAQLQESYFLQNNAYTINLEDLGFATSPADSRDGYYQLSLASHVSGFAAAATPIADGPQAGDTDCLEITLQADGTRTPAACW